jgi:hypothetical protein
MARGNQGREPIIPPNVQKDSVGPDSELTVSVQNAGVCLGRGVRNKRTDLPQIGPFALVSSSVQAIPIVCRNTIDEDEQYICCLGGAG